MIKKIVIFFFLYFILTINVCAYVAYKQGDIVNYNGIDFYVLYDSLENSNTLTLLKKEPLTVKEVETYGVGHINNYSMYSAKQVYDPDNSGYGRIVYYSSEQCGYVNNENIFDDCKNDYETSDVKYVVDSWAKDKLNEKDLWKDNLGYSYRLITKEEILEYMNYSLYMEQYFSYAPIVGKTPSWIYNEKYSYFTMTNINRINKYGTDYNCLYYVSYEGILDISSGMYITPSAIRPVVLLKKSVLNKKQNNNNSNINGNSNKSEYYNKNVERKNDNKNLIVSVPDTFTEASILSITFGLILIGTCTTIYIYIINRGKK